MLLPANAIPVELKLKANAAPESPNEPVACKPKARSVKAACDDDTVPVGVVSIAAKFLNPPAVPTQETLVGTAVDKIIVVEAVPRELALAPR